MIRPIGLVVLAAFASGSARASAQASPVAGPLVVFNAGSLARPLRDVLAAFVARHPGVRPAQENSGSVEAARKLTELGKTPDLIAVADVDVLRQLVVPAHATWFASFARNEMVLAYLPASAYADRVSPSNWFDILRRPGVRTGRSDPALDPNGYRTLMVLQLTERVLQRPGLARALEAAMPRRLMRPKEADLVALLEAGELDYIWSYRSIAVGSGLQMVDLPARIDLSDPALAAFYSEARVTLPARRGAPPLVFRGEPIVYALTVPTRAPHAAVGHAFARFVLGAEGRAILARHGFTLFDGVAVTGRAPGSVLP